MATKCYFVSDLHLSADRLAEMAHLEAVASAASDAEIVVLGGDIFDFQWSTEATIATEVQRAMDWLDRLTSRCRQCQFHYLLGNHDYHHAFIDRLGETAASIENLSWYRFYLRLGDAVFLHGDVADRRMDADGLARVRAKCLHESKRGPIFRFVYSLAARVRLHFLIHHAVFARPIVAGRIAAYLDSVGCGRDAGVRNVYFGHTHLAISEYRRGGLSFHNGGTPILGFDFRIVEADFSE